MLVGTRVKELCQERGISVAQIEREAGIPEKSISKWDKNSPSFDKVLKVIDAFGISTEEFFQVGSDKLRTVENALAQIKKASPETYDEIRSSWLDEETKELRNMLRESYGFRVLFGTSDGATDSDFLEAAAVIQRRKEERNN